MPCSDGGWSEREAEQERSREVHALRNQVNTMEPLLCSACRQLEEYGFNFDKNPALADWWANHKRKDEEREQREAREQIVKNTIKLLSKKSIDKLTKEDIAFLRKHKVI